MGDVIWDVPAHWHERFWYKRDANYIRLWKQLPTVAAARSNIAESLRAVRRRNPAMGRLLLNRLRAAEREMIEAFWFGPTSPDGADGLL